LLAFKC